MFEQVGVAGEDATTCADALVASVAAERKVVAQRFAQVARWADFHSRGYGIDTGAPRVAAGSRSEGREGAGGVPAVTPAGVAELGMLLQTTTYSAESLLRDVLELRHRLPEHWDAVMTGKVEGWRARQVARLTHLLSYDQARLVDTQVIEAVTGLPWGRAKDVVEAKVIAADPAAHAARLADEENRRFVSTRRRSNAAGLRTVVARGHAGASRGWRR